jgi:RimJ/RimL family protein N-acetyltransferase
MENSVRFLEGQRVYLRPVQQSDLDQFYIWFNDPELRGLTGETLPTSLAGMEAFYQKLQTDSERVWFAVCLVEDDRLIGETGLLRMFPAWRTTDLSIILGDRTAWAKGYGTETIILMMDYAFGYLNFHRISIGVVGTNERALRFYEKVGFKREGIQRDGYFYNHRYQDFVMLSILEDEFRRMRGR